MRGRPTACAFGLLPVVVALLLVGCSSDADTASESTSAEVALVRTVAVPPERLSPFCQAIAELDARLNDAAPDADTGAMIIDAYSAIVDEVPPEIREDFLSVLADLQEGTLDDDAAVTSTTVSTTAPIAPGTTVEDFEEGYIPDDTASLRLNSYVQFTCRDNENNPGPADTEPGPITVEPTTPT